MTPYVVVVAIVTAIAIFRRKTNEKIEKGLEAMDELYDLQQWCMDNLDNPLMSDQKWRELLPLCRFADERFRLLHRPLEYRNSSECLVLRIIARGQEEFQDASS